MNHLIRVKAEMRPCMTAIPQAGSQISAWHGSFQISLAGTVPLSKGERILTSDQYADLSASLNRIGDS